MNTKTYKLEQDGHSFEFSQKELNVRKDYRVLELLTSLELNDLNIKNIKDINYSNIVKVLTKNQALESFLNILLDLESADKGCVYDFGLMPNSTLEEIVMDFFDLNPSVKKRLLDSKLNAVLQILIKIFSNSETIAKE